MKSHHVKASIAFVIFLLHASLGTAAELFIAPAPLGADTNSGTREQPKADVQQAIWSLKPGDTLTLLPGTYTQTFSFAKSGTAEAPITVRGDASGAVILDGATLPAAGVAFSMIAVSANFITIEGLDIRNSPGWGISVWGKTNAILRGNKITGCSWGGIQLANERPFHGHPNPSADNLIEENTVVGAKAALYYGEYQKGGGLKRTRFERNTFVDGSVELLHLDPSAGHADNVFSDNRCVQTLERPVVNATSIPPGFHFSNNQWLGLQPPPPFDQ